MAFATRKTKSSILKKYISYYYFHSARKQNQSEEIVFYPNTINAITIYQKSKLTFGENWSVAEVTKDKTYNSYYSGLNKQFKISKMKSPFNKLGIAFKPLGINSFLDSPLATLISKTNDKSFNYFDNSIKSTIIEVFNTCDFDKKIDLLDSYFITKLNDFEDTILQSAIEIIKKSNEKYKVSELSELCFTTQKTLNRKFKKHLNCTIKEYLDIAQFRKSFNYYQNLEKPNKLVDLAYEFNYYDQAELSNRFRQITGVNPKKLFKNTQKFGDVNLFWNKGI
ncbi:helix-turn-helix domain-containing protein [Flavivirga jejuensis]|uniref:AraC family transcriptional regulator n=1 Tax=Flavivirga jejuensis TaxID=870487 RepID=A0ABT8WNN0_9FLAO|nr:AraC family transcriptional regulator [Flavivirga jejuensis]MDO5974778.1 AraC family transcriptional regulator [Flavivirga jejuensis]